ncbi:MAG TPA: hypothetical protein VLA89_07440, partial [Gemmatimonadales bacterium]|nr:hypothetical protein [Gemmatimonadales bacterium]
DTGERASWERIHRRRGRRDLHGRKRREDSRLGHIDRAANYVWGPDPCRRGMTGRDIATPRRS